MASISPSPRSHLASPTATYPRGILKSADSKKSSRQRLPDINSSNSGELQDAKKTTFADEDAEKTRRAIISENQARLLRYRRWSNPDINSKKKKRESDRISKITGATGNNNIPFFSPYDFYIDKLNDNNGLIRDSQKDRMKSDPEKEKKNTSLRRGFHSYNSPSHMTNMLSEWIQDASRHRGYRYYVGHRIGLLSERNLFSAGTLSKTSTSYPESRDVLSSLSRKDSFLSRISRRISLFGPQFDSHTPYTPRSENSRLRSFRWYCRVIKAVCGLKLEMQKLSINKTQQANMTEILYISAGARAIPASTTGEEGEEAQFLLFDKSSYSRGRARSRMPLWAQCLMIESPNKRPNDMVHKLRKLLMNMKSFRENITENMRYTVCKVVRYTKCDKGRVILRQGHWGFDFYFIYSGSVFVQLELYDERTKQTYPSVENVLKSGEGFGEIALLGDGKRTASIICKEPTELCQIDRETFLEICPALFHELLQEKIRLARGFPIFSFWEDDMLKKLCFLSQVLEVPHSTVLEEDWAKANFAYFVMKGRINLVRSFDATGIETASSQERSLGHVGKVMEADGEKVKHIKYAKVGTLCTGDCTDLSILSIEPRQDIPHIMLISQGVKVFRVSVRTFFRMSPRKAMEEYLKRSYVPEIFPSEDELRARFHMNISWAEFKKNVVNASVIRNSNLDLATMPATLKGTTGWARWPGYRLRSRHNMAPKFGKDRLPTPSEDIPSDWDSSDFEYSSDDNEDGDTEYAGMTFEERATMEFLSPSRCSSHRTINESSEKLVNDRSMTITPPSHRTLASLKKNLRRSFDAKSL